MTDAVQPSRVEIPVRIAVSVEAVLYLALGALALVMRLAELDVIPLNGVEAREALAVWHFVRPDAPGHAPLSASPLMFLLNSLMMTLLGGSELTARFMTALGGTGLVLLPALWRREIGRVPALVTALLLTISPVALTASRTMSPAIWSVNLAVIGLWLAWRFYQTRQAAYAVAATVAAVGVLLLADPAGFVLLLILAAAWFVAVRLSADDPPQEQPAPRLRAMLAEWPWRESLLSGGAVVLLVGTVFFLHPGGLAQVGELLGRGLEGIIYRPEGYLFAFPLLAMLLYEPVLWVFGVVGLTHALNENRFWGRFMVGWLAGALLASLLYAGAGPEYALWLVIPLAVLAGDAIARLLQPVVDPYWVVPSWAVPALALAVAALLSIAGINFLGVARNMAAAADPAVAQIEPLRLLLIGMALLLLVILFFLGGSLWGPRAAWRGIGLGIALMLGVYGVSSGWRVAVTHIDDPRELWHVNPVSRHLGLLRETVQEASYRQTGTPDQLAFIAQVPEDGAVAWQLRDYAGLRYVTAVDRRTNAPLIVAPYAFQPEVLGARYVGQDFLVTRTWRTDFLRGLDLPVWVLYGSAQVGPQVGEKVIVWMRDDVYGLPPEEVPAASGDAPAGAGEESAP